MNALVMKYKISTTMDLAVTKPNNAYPWIPKTMSDIVTARNPKRSAAEIAVDTQVK